MPAPKSASGGSRGANGARSSKSGSRTPARSKTSKSATKHGRRRPPANDDSRDGASDGLASLAEQVTNGVLKPLGLVVLTSERIQEILDDAAERGRVTRSDANELAAQLISRGRQQTDQLLSDVERLL